MSYILDALRRAEAERERGAVPSLASQQHSIEVEDEAPPRSRGLVRAVIGLAFALIAMTGMCAVAGLPANSLSAVTPLMPGRLMSIRITSGLSA